MPPRTRKTAAAAQASPLAKKSQARKAASATSPTGPPRRDEVEIVEPPVTAEAPTEPVDAWEDALGGDDEREPAVAPASRLLTQNTSEESATTTRVGADGSTLIEARTTRATSTRREYDPGHTVEETVIVTNERTERIPVPYAGPASDHPAPVG